MDDEDAAVVFCAVADEFHTVRVGIAVVVEVVRPFAVLAINPLSVVGPCERIAVEVALSHAVGALMVESIEAVAETAVADDESVVGPEGIGDAALLFGGKGIFALGLPVVQFGKNISHTVASLCGDIDENAGGQRIERILDDAHVVHLGVEKEITPIVE